MSEKTCRAYVSTEIRIKQIEDIALIYGSRTSGALRRYMTKEDFPKLAGLTEGGYAIDIYLRRDEKRKRIIIQDDRIFSDEPYEDFLSEMAKHSNEENMLQGVLAHGVKDGAADADVELDDEDKVIVWYNGIWTIVKKFPKGSFNGDNILIPVELARLILGNANSAKVVKEGILNGISKSEIYSGLKSEKIGDNKFESTSAKELAGLIQCPNLFSYWKFDGVLNIMINTHMRHGPYKLQRTNREIVIQVCITFIYDNSLNNRKTIPGLGDAFNIYKGEIVKSFELWGNGGNGRDYKETDYDKFGGDGVNVKVKIYCNNEYPSTAEVNIINTFNNDSTKHVSNVESGASLNSWRIDSVGVMHLYNHDEAGGNMEGIKYGLNASHEFGHLLGVGHSYDNPGDLEKKGTPETEVDDIMWDGAEFGPNSMEMIFMAAMKNEKQFFYSDSATNRTVSEAIRYKK